jgi:hypothetical protein
LRDRCCNYSTFPTFHSSNNRIYITEPESGRRKKKKGQGQFYSLFSMLGSGQCSFITTIAHRMLRLKELSKLPAERLHFIETQRETQSGESYVHLLF